MLYLWIRLSEMFGRTTCAKCVEDLNSAYITHIRIVEKRSFRRRTVKYVTIKYLSFYICLVRKSDVTVLDKPQFRIHHVNSLYKNRYEILDINNEAGWCNY